LAGFAGVEFDEAALIEAHEHYREYQLRFPGASDRSEVQVTLDGIAERRAEKTFEIAAFYERTEHLSSAVFYYQTVVEDWPASAAAVRARARLKLLDVGDQVNPVLRSSRINEG
jgi:outer membrane protein assembly factor BamD (BamD/ComL family)